MTWAERAAAFVGRVLARAEAERPGDAAHAISALRAASAKWSMVHEYATSKTGLAALGKTRALAIRTLRGRSSAKCRACGANPGQPCRPIADEIAPGEAHASRL